jgi:hypothetical protein
MFLPLCLAVYFSVLTLDKACPYGVGIGVKVIVGCEVGVGFRVGEGNSDILVGFATLAIPSVLVGSTTWLAIADVAVSNFGVLVADVFPQAKETKISATNTKKENRLLLLVLTTTLPF